MACLEKWWYHWPPDADIISLKPLCAKTSNVLWCHVHPNGTWCHHHQLLLHRKAIMYGVQFYPVVMNCVCGLSVASGLMISWILRSNTIMHFSDNRIIAFHSNTHITSCMLHTNRAIFINDSCLPILSVLVCLVWLWGKHNSMFLVGIVDIWH